MNSQNNIQIKYFEYDESKIYEILTYFTEY